MASIRDHRAFYAEYIVATANVRDSAVVAAFNAVERENFCGRGPWRVWTPSGYVATPSDDPAFLYQDILIGLLPELTINNGEPSLHAKCLSSVRVQPGDCVIHVGAGSGYYSAVLATLAGPNGTVHAYEIEPRMAEWARENLRGFDNVSVHAVSGSGGDLPSADVIYVSAGATEPLAVWLDALRPNGRLIFPLTPDDAVGGMLLIKRKDVESYRARFVSRASFIPCIGARDATMSEKLSAAFKNGNHDLVQSLHRSSAPGARCWVSGNGWWLAFDAP